MINGTGSASDPASWGEKKDMKVRWGRMQWPNMSLNKDFDFETWKDAALCLRGDVIFGPGSNSETLSQMQRGRA